MGNNLNTDKQLVAIIQNTEWIDLSVGHKRLRKDVEESTNIACVQKKDKKEGVSPIMVKGAFGIGKTAILNYMFHYAWTKLQVPVFLVNLEDIVVKIKEHLSNHDLVKLPNKDVSEIIDNLLSEQIDILKNINPDEIIGNQIFFPSFDKGNLTEYLSNFKSAKLHTTNNGNYIDEELPLFSIERIHEAIETKNRYLLLIDEFEAKYQELKGLIEISGGGFLRQFFDDVASISSTNFYCIIGNGPASGYELNKDLKDKSESVAADQRRLFVKQIQMPTVASLSKTFLKGYPKEHINFIWWLSRSRPGQIKKLKQNLQAFDELKEHNYIQFLRENKDILNQPIDDIGESNVTFLKTELVENLSIGLKNLFKSTLINLGPYELDTIDEKFKEELSANKELFYASTELTKVSDIISSLQEDIIKIRDNSKKYSQVNFDSLHTYIDLILSSISNQDEEIVFGVINKSDVDEYLSKLFLTPLLSNLYDFITIYEDEHDRKVKTLLDFILELIHKSEKEDSETLFPSSFDLFERGSVRIKNRGKIYVQLNIKSIRETIEQPIGSPKLPYKTDSLQEKILKVDSIKKVFIWNKNEKEEIIIIPNYDNDALLESYLERLKTYFQDNWSKKKNYFGDGDLISNIVYLEESDLINEFKEWLCYSDGSEELPYKLKRLDFKHINSYQIHNSQRISDFISSLTKIATVGLYNGDIKSKSLIKSSDNESETIVRVDKIVDLILDANWTESKQTRRTIEYYKDLLLTEGNSTFESFIQSARNTFTSSIEEIVPNKDKIKKHLLNISIEDRIFEEAYSVQTKNLFNLMLSEIKEKDISTLKPILKSTREYRFRPSSENKDVEVSLMDLFFSFEKNKNIKDCIADYNSSSLEKYLSRFADLLSEYIEVDSLSDLVNYIYQDKTVISSYSKALNFYETNIPYLNGFYFLALTKKLDYNTEQKNVKDELENIQKEFNELEGELSDKLYDLKELTNTDSELNYNTELRSYITSLIQPLINLLENNTNISYLILTDIISRYLKNTIKRANRFKKQINNIVRELEAKKSIIETKQGQYDNYYNKSIIHKKLISQSKTGDFFYNAKYVKSFKFDNSFNLIFGDINKFKPSDKYYIDDNELKSFLSSLKKSYDKKLPEINQDIEEAKEIDAEIEEVLKVEESIITLISTDDNE